MNTPNLILQIVSIGLLVYIIIKVTEIEKELSQDDPGIFQPNQPVNRTLPTTQEPFGGSSMFRPIQNTEPYDDDEEEEEEEVATDKIEEAVDGEKITLNDPDQEE